MQRGECAVKWVIKWHIMGNDIIGAGYAVVGISCREAWLAAFSHPLRRCEKHKLNEHLPVYQKTSTSACAAKHLLAIRFNWAR